MSTTNLPSQTTIKALEAAVAAWSRQPAARAGDGGSGGGGAAAGGMRGEATSALQMTGVEEAAAAQKGRSLQIILPRGVTLTSG